MWKCAIVLGEGPFLSVKRARLHPNNYVRTCGSTSSDVNQPQTLPSTLHGSNSLMGVLIIPSSKFFKALL